VEAGRYRGREETAAEIRPDSEQNASDPAKNVEQASDRPRWPGRRATGRVETRFRAEQTVSEPD
jgi:hypothetical protein